MYSTKHRSVKPLNLRQSAGVRFSLSIIASVILKKWPASSGDSVPESVLQWGTDKWKGNSWKTSCSASSKENKMYWFPPPLWNRDWTSPTQKIGRASGREKGRQ